MKGSTSTAASGHAASRLRRKPSTCSTMQGRNVSSSRPRAARLRFDGLYTSRIRRNTTSRDPDGSTFHVACTRWRTAVLQLSLVVSARKNAESTSFDTALGLSQPHHTQHTHADVSPPRDGHTAAAAALPLQRTGAGPPPA